MRVWVVDPGARHPGGHHVTADMGILEQCSRRNAPVVFFVNKSFPRSFTDTGLGNPLLPAIPVFGFSHHDCPILGEQALALTKKFNEAFFKIMTTVVSGVICTGDVLILHTVDARFLHGLARWLVKELEGKKFRVLLQLSGADITTGHGISKWQQTIYRAALQPLVSLGPERVLLLAETEGLRQRIQALAGFQCGILVFPPFKPEAPMQKILQQSRSVDQLPCIGFLGQLRPERGVGILPRSVKEYLEQHPGTARFEVQAAVPPNKGTEILLATFPHILQEIKDIRNLGGVTVIDDALSTEDYYALLGRTDIVFQMKSGVDSIGGSGVVLEALASGKINVLPKYSEQEKLLKSLDAPLVEIIENSPGSVADALWRAVRDIEDLRPKALAAAHAWNKSHSLTALFESILDTSDS
jgi:glycosyltransferase involved in cell wall biosynthesis